MLLLTVGGGNHRDERRLPAANGAHGVGVWRIIWREAKMLAKIGTAKWREELAKEDPAKMAGRFGEERNGEN